MTMNRRNVLVGLGTIVAGGGAALGTGAFSSVEADRTVDIQTAGDDAAFLQIRSNSDYGGTASDYVDETGDTITIDIGSGSDGINKDATTTFKGLLEVENAGTQGVGFYVKDDDTNLGDVLDFAKEDASSIVGENAAVELDDADGTEPTVTVTIEIDLTSAAESDIPGEVTFVADADQYTN